MIIQIRGTSGSGKSTSMRKTMELLGGPWNQVTVAGRKRPLYYERGDYPKNIVVLGHYESPCGGCDTIGSAAAVYELIQSLQFGHLLCEGLLLSEDVKWSKQLKNLRVLFLTTPLEQCLSNIQKRREVAGNTKELNPANTSNRVETIQRARAKLVEAGVSCRRCSADQAPEIIRKWILG